VLLSSFHDVYWKHQEVWHAQAGWKKPFTFPMPSLTIEAAAALDIIWLHFSVYPELL